MKTFLFTFNLQKNLGNYKIYKISIIANLINHFIIHYSIFFYLISVLPLITN